MKSSYNTVRLLRGEAFLKESEYQKFKKGDTIWGNDSDPDILNVWNISEDKEANIQKAKDTLASYQCSYRKTIEGYAIYEYALEYYDSDEDGDFLDGADFDLAEEQIVIFDFCMNT